MEETLPEKKSPSNVCLFISSSDNTRDIFYQVHPAYQKFWPDLPFDRYVGLNSPASHLTGDFQVVQAPTSGWRTELYQQVMSLPRRFDYILLFLDDFLILSRVKTKHIEALATKAIRAHLKYLRLIPQTRAWLPQAGKSLKTAFNPSTIEKIPKCTPYYSSLQVAFWEKGHLCDMLRLGGNIWDFENRSIQGVEHYAVAGPPAINYIHVVEKGHWEPNVDRLFRKVGIHFDPSVRKMRPTHHLMWLWLNRLKFNLIGYSVVRLKRRILRRQKDCQ
jgi:hypothetical protein